MINAYNPKLRVGHKVRIVKAPNLPALQETINQVGIIEEIYKYQCRVAFAGGIEYEMSYYPSLNFEGAELEIIDNDPLPLPG